MCFSSPVSKDPWLTKKLETILFPEESPSSRKNIAMKEEKQKLAS